MLTNHYEETIDAVARGDHFDESLCSNEMSSKKEVNKYSNACIESEYAITAFTHTFTLIDIYFCGLKIHIHMWKLKIASFLLCRILSSRKVFKITKIYVQGSEHELALLGKLVALWLSYYFLPCLHNSELIRLVLGTVWFNLISTFNFIFCAWYNGGEWHIYTKLDFQ